ncbi:hypothetical protein ACQKQC_19750 [Vibrio fortis]|uniref:hypothetical protein n=1 Tax=Vibrio fortis TaxID=212667 RepID=UPI004068A138
MYIKLGIAVASTLFFSGCTSTLTSEPINQQDKNTKTGVVYALKKTQFDIDINLELDRCLKGKIEYTPSIQVSSRTIADHNKSYLLDVDTMHSWTKKYGLTTTFTDATLTSFSVNVVDETVDLAVGALETAVNLALINQKLPTKSISGLFDTNLTFPKDSELLKSLPENVRLPNSVFGDLPKPSIPKSDKYVTCGQYLTGDLDKITREITNLIETLKIKRSMYSTQFDALTKSIGTWAAKANEKTFNANYEKIEQLSNQIAEIDKSIYIHNLTLENIKERRLVTIPLTVDFYNARWNNDKQRVEIPLDVDLFNHGARYWFQGSDNESINTHINSMKPEFILVVDSGTEQLKSNYDFRTKPSDSDLDVITPATNIEMAGLYYQTYGQAKIRIIQVHHTKTNDTNEDTKVVHEENIASAWITSPDFGSVAAVSFKNMLGEENGMSVTFNSNGELSTVTYKTESSSASAVKEGADSTLALKKHYKDSTEVDQAAQDLKLLQLALSDATKKHPTDIDKAIERRDLLIPLYKRYGISHSSTDSETKVIISLFEGYSNDDLKKL